MRECLITIPGPRGPIPTLAAGDPHTARAGVVLGYGMGAEMHVQWPEAERLAAAGYAVVIPEMPHHGLRADGYLDRMRDQPDDVTRPLFLDMVEECAAELPFAIDHLVAAGASCIVCAGFSISGCIALAGPSRDPRVELVVAFMADPAWSGRPSAPERAPAAFAGRGLFVVTADDDTVVPPARVRAFVSELAQRSTDPDRYVEVRYRGGHMMDPATWDDAWTRAIAWLDRRTLPRHG